MVTLSARRRGGSVLFAVALLSCMPSAGMPDTSAGSASSPTARPEPSATATAPPSLAPPLSFTEYARATRPTVVRGRVDAEHLLFVSAVAPDGRTALGTVDRIDASDGQRRTVLEVAQIVTVDTATGQRTPVRSLPTPQHAMGITDADERWSVWIERDSHALLTDWTLFALDRSSGSIHQVARAPRNANGEPIASLTFPAVDNGVLIWREPIPGAVVGDRETSRLLSVRLPDGTPEEITRAGQGAAISWPHIAWSERREDRTDGSFRIVRRDLRSGAQQVVLAADDPTYVAIHGLATAWVERRTGHIWLAETPDSPRILVAEAPRDRDAPFQELSLSEHVVGWASNSYPGFYDRRLRRIVLVDEIGLHVGWQTVVRGDIVTWGMRPTDTGHVQSVRDFAILRVPNVP